jgi:hypothetical protein
MLEGTDGVYYLRAGAVVTAGDLLQLLKYTIEIADAVSKVSGD